MQVFFMDVTASARVCEEAGVGAWPEAGEKAVRLGFGHRRPFILGSDGSYDHRLNAFFGACPTFGVRSAASQRAYAYEVELARQAAADLYVGNLAAAHAAGARSAGGGARRVNARLEELAAELGQDATAVLADFRAAAEIAVKPAKPIDDAEAGRMREALAEAEAKLAARNAEVRRLRADLAALACRVALLSEENAQLRGDKASPVVALPGR